jgi:hypothetical protein
MAVFQTNLGHSAKILAATIVVVVVLVRASSYLRRRRSIARSTCVVTSRFLKVLTFNSGGLALPPGPPRKFLFGNLTEINAADKIYEKGEEWRKRYGGWLYITSLTRHLIGVSGDVVYTEALGHPIVWLNSWEVAWDLLETRSSAFSDRVNFPMLNDL